MHEDTEMKANGTRTARFLLQLSRWTNLEPGHKKKNGHVLLLEPVDLNLVPVGHYMW